MPFVPEEGHRIVRDVFVFSCYTGLSYSDVKKLKNGNVVRGIDGRFWLFLERTKTNYPLRIPLLEEAMLIMERYRDAPGKARDALLPVFVNQKMNSYIKEVAKKIGIDKNLTFHSARHTICHNGHPFQWGSHSHGIEAFGTHQDHNDPGLCTSIGG